MTSKKSFSTIMLCFAFLIGWLSVAQSQVLSGGYQVNYRSGYAPFVQNTDLIITRRDGHYLFSPKQGDAWSLPVTSMRGAVAAANGVWIYWFDDADNTQSGFFQTSNAVAQLVSDINQSVNMAYGKSTSQPVDADKAKANYEAYKVQALKESK